MDPYLSTRQYQPDVAGRVDVALDESGHKTSYRYDDLNRIIAVGRFSSPTDSLVTRYNYNVDVLESVVDPRSVKRTYEYDQLGRVTAEFDEDSVGEYRSLNLAGLPESITTRNGHTITMTYDGAGRLTKRKWPARSQSSFTTNVTVPADSQIIAYSVNGWVDSVRTAGYKVVNTHYPNGRLASQRQSLLNNTQAVTNSYTYDVGGRRLSHRIGSLTDSTDADVVRYRYHSTTGLLSSIRVRWRDSLLQDSVLFQWDELGRRRQLHYMMSHAPSRPIKVNFSYDAAGRFRRVCSSHNAQSGTSVFMFRTAHTDVAVDGLIAERGTGNLNWDCPNGNYAGGVTVQSSAYDSLHQLVSQQQGAANTQLYNYDASGNMIAQGEVFSSQTVWTNALISSGSNRLLRWGGSGMYVPHYTYHPDGSRRVERLLQPSDTSNGQVSSLSRYYFYDALGRTTGYQRYACTGMFDDCQVQPPAPTACKYGPTGALWTSCGGAGGTRLGYDGANVVRTAADDAIGWTFVHGPGLDDPILGHKRGTFASEHWYYFWVTDGNGRLFAVGDSVGVNRSSEQPGSALVSGEDPGAVAESWGFGATRSETSALPGLSFFRNRFYDQSTGRWTQEDPMGVAGGVNLYAYSGNNPVSHTDPFGLDPEDGGYSDPCGRMRSQEAKERCREIMKKRRENETEEDRAYAETFDQCIAQVVEGVARFGLDVGLIWGYSSGLMWAGRGMAFALEGQAIKSGLILMATSAGPGMSGQTGIDLGSRMVGGYGSGAYLVASDALSLLPVNTANFLLNGGASACGEL